MTDERDPPFNPELADDRLAAWVDGELSGKDLDRFEAELRVNKRLREQAESYRSFVQSMQGALQQPLGSIDIGDRVIAALQRPVALASRRSMVLPWLLSACVAAGLLTAVWIMQGDPPCPPEVRESATAPAPENSKLAAGNEKRPEDQPDARAEMEKRKADLEVDKSFQETAGKPALDARVAKAPAEKERELGDVPVLLKDQSARSDQKLEEAKNKTGDDDFYKSASQREGGQPADKSKKAAEGAPPPGATGQPAPGSKPAADPAASAPVQQSRPGSGEQEDKEQGLAKQPARDGLTFRGMTQDLAAVTTASVQVVVLTRRGTIDELRRNLQPRESGAEENARPQGRYRAAATPVEEQLGQQFPSLALTQTESLQSRAARLQQTWSNNGPPLQLFSLGIPDVKASYFRSGFDQGRQGTGNRMPDDPQGRARDEALQRLLPEGTRANALYVEGDPARMQDFLKQVGTWAANNDLTVAADELPVAEVENLKLSQQTMSQLQGQEPKTNAPALTGGAGGGRAIGGPTGPATPGPAGTSTSGPAGPTTGGPAAKRPPEPVPGAPEPLPAPTKAVLLLFREQTELPTNKR